MEENLNANQETKKSIKNIIPIIAIVVAIVLLLTGVFFMLGRRNSDTTDLSLIFDEDKLIPVKVNNLYGYISPKNGKMVIEPTFSSAYSFYGKYASVSYSENGSTKYGIIDKSGKVKLSTSYSFGIKVLSEYGLFIVDNVLYNKNLKALTDENTYVTYENSGYCSYTQYDKDRTNVEYGILSPDGKKIYSSKSKSIETSFHCSIGDTNKALDEIYAVVSADSTNYSIINLKNGKVVYKCTDYIYPEDNNIFRVSSTENDSTSGRTLCIAKNKIAYETTENVDVSYYDYEKQILQIYDSSKSYSDRYSYYDLNKKSILSEKPEKSSDDSLSSLIGYSSYSNNSKYGVMKNDKVILPCEYDKVEFLPYDTYTYLKDKKHQELVLVKKDNEYSLVNLKNKKTITSFKTSSITTYSTSTFINGKLKDSNEYFVYNILTGKMATFDSSSTVSVYSNYITVSKNGNLTYYNTNLKEIYNQ